MKHTPGPWKVKFKKDCDWQIRSADGYSILAIPHDEEYGRPSEDSANANLIAAAPEMFEVLETMRAYFDHRNLTPPDKAAIQTMDMIIKKARGES